MITSDFHMHTEFSLDSGIPVREMVEASIQKELGIICITDHEDGADPEEEMHIKDPENYVHTIQNFREEYRDRIEIRIGIEIGIQTRFLGYTGLIQSYPFDFVIGSLHKVSGQDPYFRTIFKELGEEEVYRRMFLEMAECARRSQDFDVLGHMDYAVRYGKNSLEDYSYRKFSDEIDEALRAVIETGKGIELNTSGWKYGLPFCHPLPDIIKRYRELGGEILTIGSDGHRPEHIAYDFDKVPEILEYCGFRYYTEFKDRKPVFKHF